MGLKGFFKPCSYATYFDKTRLMLSNRFLIITLDHFFLLKRSFCRKMSSNPPHQMGLVSWHLFLRPEIKTGKRFHKERSVQDCYQKISLDNQYCSWQTFPDIRSSSFCTQDVVSMEQESITAQIRLPFKRKMDSFTLPSLMLIFILSKCKYLAH